MSENKQYEIESRNGADCVVVRCPRGHRSVGRKVDDLTIRQTMTCTNEQCNAQWVAVLPSVLFLEACAW